MGPDGEKLEQNEVRRGRRWERRGAAAVTASPPAEPVVWAVSVGAFAELDGGDVAFGGVPPGAKSLLSRLRVGQGGSPGTQGAHWYERGEDRSEGGFRRT